MQKEQHSAEQSTDKSRRAWKRQKRTGLENSVKASKTA